MPHRLDRSQTVPPRYRSGCTTDASPPSSEEIRLSSPPVSLSRLRSPQRSPPRLQLASTLGTSPRGSIAEGLHELPIVGARALASLSLRGGAALPDRPADRRPAGRPR